ncbi:hypothetical protein K8T06_13425 [bacterium]|nr:hypothetical protein [bacterium]
MVIMMMNNPRGSILVMTLMVLVIVLGFMAAGYSFFMTYAHEASSLRASLTARHTALSGLAFYTVNRDQINQWITTDDGEFRLEVISQSENLRKIRSTGRTVGNPRAAATVSVNGLYRKTGSQWKLVQKKFEGVFL